MADQYTELSTIARVYSTLKGLEVREDELALQKQVYQSREAREQVELQLSQVRADMEAARLALSKQEAALGQNRLLMDAFKLYRKYVDDQQKQALSIIQNKNSEKSRAIELSIKLENQKTAGRPKDAEQRVIALQNLKSTLDGLATASGMKGTNIDELRNTLAQDAKVFTARSTLKDYADGFMDEYLKANPQDREAVYSKWAEKVQAFDTSMSEGRVAELQAKVDGIMGYSPIEQRILDGVKAITFDQWLGENPDIANAIGKGTGGSGTPAAPGTGQPAAPQTPQVPTMENIAKALGFQQAPDSPSTMIGPVLETAPHTYTNIAGEGNTLNPEYVKAWAKGVGKSNETIKNLGPLYELMGMQAPRMSETPPPPPKTMPATQPKPKPTATPAAQKTVEQPQGTPPISPVKADHPGGIHKSLYDALGKVNPKKDPTHTGQFIDFLAEESGVPPEQRQTFKVSVGKSLKQAGFDNPYSQ